jgi:uncharacterized protein
VPPVGQAQRLVDARLARRLFLTRQRLAGPVPAGVLEVADALGCLQLDPIAVVARSHRLVCWSRLGVHDQDELDRLLWRERRLFEYWTHAASIVRTEDYPIHSLLMRRYPSDRNADGRRVRAWLVENDELRRAILRRLAADGPLPSRALEDASAVAWRSSGWTSGRNVSRMLDVLWTQGRILVAGRAGQQRLWDLAERWLPAWTPLERPPEREVVRRAAQLALRALGVARARDIDNHFTVGRDPGLDAVLRGLERAGRVERVRVVADGGAEWPGPWFVHADDVPLLERLAAGEWAPRTTLLSPFDNLIADRRRTELLFGFTQRLEIYVPKAKRRWGYYVLPVLHGDRLVGRVDPALDRDQGRLLVHAAHAEPGADTAATGRAVAGAIHDLAAFLGAGAVEVRGPAPPAWRPALG